MKGNEATDGEKLNKLKMKHYLPKQYFKIPISKIHVYLGLKSNLIYIKYSFINMNEKKLLLYIYIHLFNVVYLISS